MFIFRVYNIYLTFYIYIYFFLSIKDDNYNSNGNI